MWLLVIVHFAGAMQIDKINVIETHWNKEKCIQRVRQAEQIGLPVNTNVGCIKVKEIKKV
jgi:hypothetical protein